MKTRRVGIVLAMLVAAVVLTATPASAWIWEGCTPGFWKRHIEYWPPTGVTPSTLLISVDFSEVGSYDLSGDTFMDALNYRGGTSLVGAARNLMRAAAAAYLNAAHPLVNYPRSTGWIVFWVNAALASHNRDTMLSLAALLDQWNNLGATF